MIKVRDIHGREDEIDATLFEADGSGRLRVKTKDPAGPEALYAHGQWVRVIREAEPPAQDSAPGDDAASIDGK